MTKIYEFSRDKMLRLSMKESISDVCSKFNIGSTSFKQYCRKLKIYKWPHRKFKALQDLANFHHDSDEYKLYLKCIKILLNELDKDPGLIFDIDFSDKNKNWFSRMRKIKNKNINMNNYLFNTKETNQSFSSIDSDTDSFESNLNECNSIEHNKAEDNSSRDILSHINNLIIKNKKPYTRKHKKCIHNRNRSFCKLCDGSQICEHDKQRQYCIECKGIAICEHYLVKYHCKLCKQKNGSIVLLRDIQPDKDLLVDNSFNYVKKTYYENNMFFTYD